MRTAIKKIVYVFICRWYGKIVILRDMLSPPFEAVQYCMTKSKFGLKITSTDFQVIIWNDDYQPLTHTFCKFIADWPCTCSWWHIPVKYTELQFEFCFSSYWFFLLQWFCNFVSGTRVKVSSFSGKYHKY